MRTRGLWTLFGTVAIVIAVTTAVAINGRAQDATPAAATPCPSPEGTPLAATPVGMAEGTPAMGTPEACPSGAMTVEMVDIAFNPKTLTIPANTDVTITLPNSGAIPHNFNIDELNIHSGDVAPGASTTVTINAPAGTYKYYCSIPGHEAAGMVGELIVQ